MTTVIIESPYDLLIERDSVPEVPTSMIDLHSIDLNLFLIRNTECELCIQDISSITEIEYVFQRVDGSTYNATSRVVIGSVVISRI